MGLPFFYGWLIVVIAGIAKFATGPGQTFTVATFIEPMRADLHLSQTTFSAAYSMASLLAAGGMIVLGRVIDRIGGRHGLIVFGLLSAVACYGMSLVHGVLSLTVGFLALRMVCAGALGLASTVVVVEWFVRFRGRAVGLSTLGLAASSASLPIVALSLINRVGWRSTWHELALFVGLAVALPAFLFVHDSPERLGLQRDGGAAPAAVLAHDETVRVGADGWTMREALHTRTFWLLLFVVAVPSLVSTGLTFHQVTYLVEQHLKDVVPAVFVAYGLANAASIFLSGFVFERLAPSRVLFGLLCLLASSVGLLILVGVFPLVAVGYGLLLGAAGGGMSTASGVVWVAYYGRRSAGSLLGLDATVKLVASALGPLPLALSHDWLGSYIPGLLCFALVTGLAGAAAIGCRAPTPRRWLSSAEA